MAQFFVSCQLGHENLLRLEIENIWHMLIDLDGMPTRSRPEVVDVDKGGIEIECPLHLGLQLNYFLKTALRVLLRLEKFQARYFDQFEKELKKISQQVVTKYYDADCFHIEIDSSKSRLFHEKHLQECADKIFKTKNDVENKQNLFIRLYKDSVTVSIDTTGEHLHKRGYRQQQGAAPLRETLAATTLQYWLQDQSQNGINPLQSDKTVIFDPFCGAGTLLFEALSLYAPHLYRPMNFLNWKNRPGFFQSATWKKNFRWHQDILANEKFRTYGTEIDPITFEKFNNNVKTFSELFEMNIEARCQIKNQKAQDVLLTDFHGDDQVYIITNPPYGERLEDFGSEKILEKLFSNLSQVKGLLCLHPENWKWQELRRLSQVKFQIPFSNQGLDLKMTYFEKK